MSKAWRIAKNVTPNENLLINGDFRVSQRGNGFFSETGYHVDRFFSDLSPSEAESRVNVGKPSLSTPVPFTGNSVLNYNRLTATSTQSTVLGQRVEGVSSTLGFVTLSFWAINDTVTGSPEVELVPRFYRHMGNNEQYQIYINEEFLANPIVIGSEWKYYTITVNVTNPAAVSEDKSVSYFEVSLLDMGNNGTYSLKFANMKLEEGEYATNFVHRPYPVELALCQRYFWKDQNILVSSGTGESFVSFPVTMRAEPSLSIEAAATGVLGESDVYGSHGFIVKNGGTSDLYLNVEADAEIVSLEDEDGQT